MKSICLLCTKQEDCWCDACLLSWGWGHSTLWSTCLSCKTIVDLIPVSSHGPNPLCCRILLIAGGGGNTRSYAVVLGRTQSKKTLPGVSRHKRNLHQQLNLCPQFNVRDRGNTFFNMLYMAKSFISEFLLKCEVVRWETWLKG